MKWLPAIPTPRCQLTVPLSSSAVVGTANGAAETEPASRRTGFSKTSFLSSVPTTPNGPRRPAVNVPRPRPVNAIRGWSAPAPAPPPAPNASPSTGSGALKSDATRCRTSARETTAPLSLKSCLKTTHA